MSTERLIDLVGRVVYGTFAGLVLAYLYAQDVVREMRR